MSHPTPEAELLINENRFLKQTIITLREELTKKEFETHRISSTGNNPISERE